MAADDTFMELCADRNMFIANRLYVDPLRSAIAKAPEGLTGEVRRSRFGKWLVKVSEPSGNLPTPKPVLPRQDAQDWVDVQGW